MNVQLPFPSTEEHRQRPVDDIEAHFFIPRVGQSSYFGARSQRISPSRLRLKSHPLFSCKILQSFLPELSEHLKRLILCLVTGPSIAANEPS